MRGMLCGSESSRGGCSLAEVPRSCQTPRDEEQACDRCIRLMTSAPPGATSALGASIARRASNCAGFRRSGGMNAGFGPTLPSMIEHYFPEKNRMPDNEKPHSHAIDYKLCESAA